MNVFIERDQESKIVSANTVGELLSMLKINPDTVLVTKNGSLVTEDELVTDDDKIKILSVISGG